MNTLASRSIFAAAGIALGVTFSSVALAGECPADKLRTDARASGETKPVGVTDKVLGAIDLSKEKVNLADRKLRLRKLVVQPGGIVPWHSHGDRPALIYIVSGTITEYASNCLAPIEHKAGDTSSERNGVQHWWKNNGRVPVVLLSADLFHAEQDSHTM